jgi:hypothetical protein
MSKCFPVCPRNLANKDKREYGHRCDQQDGEHDGPNQRRKRSRLFVMVCHRLLPLPSRPRAAPELGPAILERPKAKKIRQTAALQCFLLVAFCGDFDEKLRGCSCNGLCQGRGGASR